MFFVGSNISGATIGYSGGVETRRSHHVGRNLSPEMPVACPGSRSIKLAGAVRVEREPESL